MRTVVFCVGLPGSGKSTNSDLIKARRNVNANVIHVEEWLKVHHELGFDKYGNEIDHIDTWLNLWRHVRDVFKSYGGPVILDMWMPSPMWRKETVDGLRAVLGEVRAVCWHFVTQNDICRERYIARQLRACNPDIDLLPDDYYRRRYLENSWDGLRRWYVPVSVDELGPIFDEIVECDNSYERVT